MSSACWTCKYISQDMQYCGKGLAVRSSRNCSGYVESIPVGDWSIHPGCSFPVTDFTEAYTSASDGIPRLYQSYHVESYNDALSYTVGELTWVKKVLDDVGIGGWTMDMNTYLDGSTKIDIYNPNTTNTQAVIERCTGRLYSLEDINYHNSIVGPEPLWWAWWANPTLSYQEGIPMYALLLVVDNLGNREQLDILVRALEVGWNCQGKPLQDWADAISRMQNPPSIENLWGELVYPRWLAQKDAIYKWLAE